MEEFQLNIQLNIFRIFVPYPRHGDYAKHQIYRDSRYTLN